MLILIQTSSYGHCYRQEVDGPAGWVGMVVLQSVMKACPQPRGQFWARAEPRAEPTVISSQAELQSSICTCLAWILVKSHRWDGEAEVASQAGKGSVAKGLAPDGINLSQAVF